MPCRIEAKFITASKLTSSAKELQCLWYFWSSSPWTRKSSLYNWSSCLRSKMFSKDIRLYINTLLQGEGLLLMSELLNNHQKVFVFSLNLVKVLENNNLITEFIHLLLLSNVIWLHWFHRIEWLVRVWYKPNWFSEVKLLAPINMQRIPLKIKALDPIFFKDLLVLLLTDIGSAETFRFEPQGLVSMILLYKAVVLRLNQKIFKLLSYFDVLNFHGIALSLHFPLLMFELLDDSVSFLKLNGILL